jgi:hypothetical protein
VKHGCGAGIPAGEAGRSEVTAKAVDRVKAVNDSGLKLQLLCTLIQPYDIGKHSY